MNFTFGGGGFGTSNLNSSGFGGFQQPKPQQVSFQIHYRLKLISKFLCIYWSSKALVHKQRQLLVRVVSVE